MYTKVKKKSKLTIYEAIKPIEFHKDSHTFLHPMRTKSPSWLVFFCFYLCSLYRNKENRCVMLVAIHLPSMLTLL